MKLIFGFFLFFSLYAQAFDPLAFLSTNQKMGIEDYKRAIGVNVSGNDNSGLSNFNDNLLNQNSCLKKLAMTLVGICGHDNILQSTAITCPTEYSNIYYPESLGKGVDISSTMRRRVVMLQGDNNSGLYIPNKYYHTIGAASTACLLLRRGVPAALAQTIILTAVNGYRSGRLCETFLNPGFSNFKMEDQANLAIALRDGPQSSA